MLEIEILGNKPATEAAKAELENLALDGVQEYEHRGFAGEAGVFGLVAKILPQAIPAFFKLLKSLVARDRDLKVSFDGYEFVVRDVPELETLLDMLAARGVGLPRRQT